MNTELWIVIAVAAIVVIVGLALVARRAISHRRHRKAESIREDARRDAAQLERRQALGNETAARARAAQAEAEAKAAEAARLHDRAAVHQSQVAAAREELDETWQRADRVDPRVKTDDKSRDPDKHVEQQSRH
jgi:hypothetical protein